jgi:hypothetical protein
MPSDGWLCAEKAYVARRRDVVLVRLVFMKAIVGPANDSSLNCLS